MPATPCPGNPGCRCAYCFGLAEYMTAATGRDHGLPATYKPWQPEPATVPEVIQLRPRVAAPQPWEPRSARRAA